MPDVSSANRAAHPAAVPASPSARPRALAMPAATRLVMVAFGFIPAIHVVATITPLALAAGGYTRWQMAWLSPLILFLAPPLLVRLSTVRRPFASGAVALDSRAFLHWWYSAQWQILFARLPFLEEVLRLVPGLYSMWLRLWGARIGSLIYWSPGVAVLDRPLVRVGSRVVFGVGVRLNAHVLAPDVRGLAALFVAPISIGDDALIGGYSLLLPGCVVAAGEVTPPYRSIHAFSRFEGGRRRPGVTPAEEEADE